MKSVPGALVFALALAALPLRGDAPASAPANEGQPIEKWIQELKLVAELVKQLDDPKFEVRRIASERLERVGKPAVEPLKRVLESNPSLETAARITAVLRAIQRDRRASNPMRKKLADPITLEQGFGAGCTLADAMEFLGNRFEINIIVDENAFAGISVPKPLETAVSLPKMSGVSLSTVLRLLAGQVKGDVHAGTYLIHPDWIEITTTYHANPIHFREADGIRPSEVPAVSADFDREPLEGALRELSESSGINILVDPRSGEKARRLMSCTFDRLPLDTAVRLLADMADLRAVSLDGVLYVTSLENAKEMEAEKKQRAAREQEQGKAKEGVPGGK